MPSKEFDYSKCFRRVYVLGKKGSGKTTIINLLKNIWYDATKTEFTLPEFVEIDGTDLNVDFPIAGEVVLVCHDGNKSYRGLMKMERELSKNKSMAVLFVITKIIDEESDEFIKFKEKIGIYLGRGSTMATVHMDSFQGIDFVAMRIVLMFTVQVQFNRPVYDYDDEKIMSYEDSKNLLQTYGRPIINQIRRNIMEWGDLDFKYYFRDCYLRFDKTAVLEATGLDK